MSEIKVCVVGAGGLVGSRVVAGLERTGMTMRMVVTGHGKSVGAKMSWHGADLTIEKHTAGRVKDADLVILCTPTESSRQIAEELRGGPVVFDTSSAFRMDPDVPLVVVDVNPDDAFSHKGLIAGPNCSTIQLVMALKPILDRWGLERIHVATYQAVSGIGYRAVRQLEEESMERLCPDQETPPRESETSQFPHPMAFNVIPQVDSFLPDGYTKEEMKMANETRKILKTPQLRFSCTCARVPVFVGHCEECLVETQQPADLDELREALSSAKGVIVVDDVGASQYPMPVTCENSDYVYVGRIRKDLSSENGLLLWVAADNLLIGAATNAVNVATLLLS